MVWIEGCQIEVKRYALLDTDFISKTYSVQDDGGNHLIDRVMELPEYEFFCHAQIVTELNRYNADTPIWLSEKIGAQKIKSYTDQEILESLSLVRGPLACATYTQMLKLACDAFSKDYFSEHYRALEEADYTVISNWTLADAEPYIESLIAFYQAHHQTTFRVMEASEVRRLQRIPCRQVLQEIFDGKFIELKNGMLRYKQ